MIEHTEDVVCAACSLFGESEPTRLATAWLRFFKLLGGCYRQFRHDLVAAAWLHDLGKANDGFRAAVQNRGEQNIRHEHLSALLMDFGPVSTWLRTSPVPVDWDVVLAAVATHHLKAPVEEFGKQRGKKLPSMER
ncbi:MAG: CRISPR-associated endonuclease Cas3'', partial [Planctomycetota bacterium]